MERERGQRVIANDNDAGLTIASINHARKLLCDLERTFGLFLIDSIHKIEKENFYFATK